MISIHALLAESDRTGPLSTSTKRRFLSTLSLRRATMTTNISNLKVFYFYPRSPCGERRSFFKRLFGIHEEFLSTLSLRRATGLLAIVRRRIIISIHALLAESDGQRLKASTVIDHFYPRSPCGERPIIIRVCYYT